MICYNELQITEDHSKVTEQIQFAVSKMVRNSKEMK